MLAVVPIKAFAKAKQRLSGALSPTQRAGLSMAMSRDVIAALARSSTISRIAICAGDRDAIVLAEEFGAEFICETTLGVTGLNRSVAAVAKRFAAVGQKSMLVVHSDIPGLRADDVDRVAQTLATCDVAIAPDRQYAGSNMLGWHLAKPFAPRYGRRSFARHLIQAMSRGLQLRVCHLSSPRLDIDRPEDLRAFLALGESIESTFTAAFIREHALADNAARCFKTGGAIAHA